MHRNNKLNLDKMKFNLFNMLQFFYRQERHVAVGSMESLCRDSGQRRTFGVIHF